MEGGTANDQSSVWLFDEKKFVKEKTPAMETNMSTVNEVVLSSANPSQTSSYSRIGHIVNHDGVIKPDETVPGVEALKVRELETQVPCISKHLDVADVQSNDVPWMDLSKYDVES